MQSNEIAYTAEEWMKIYNESYSRLREIELSLRKHIQIMSMTIHHKSVSRLSDVLRILKEEMEIELERMSIMNYIEEKTVTSSSS